MKVIITKSFIDRIDGVKYRMAAGDEPVDMPKGATWIEAGFAEPVKRELTKAVKMRRGEKAVKD